MLLERKGIRSLRGWREHIWRCEYVGLGVRRLVLTRLPPQRVWSARLRLPGLPEEDYVDLEAQRR